MHNHFYPWDTRLGLLLLCTKHSMYSHRISAISIAHVVVTSGIRAHVDLNVLTTPQVVWKDPRQRWQPRWYVNTCLRSKTMHSEETRFRFTRIWKCKDFIHDNRFNIVVRVVYGWNTFLICAIGAFWIPFCNHQYHPGDREQTNNCNFM